MCHLVKGIFQYADASDYIEVNNELLEVFMDKALDKHEPFDEKYIKEVIHLVSKQNLFIAKLKDLESKDM